LKGIEAEIEEIRLEKEGSIKEQDFEKAANLRDREKNAKKRYDDVLEHWRSTSHERIVDVTEEDIMSVVSKWTGVPLQRMEQAEAEKLLKMEAELKGKVIGQDEAVIAISKALRRSRADLKDPRRPIGSFLFLGPTGVGKTFLAKNLAEFMFGTAEALIQIDMSEYMEKHTASRLIGAPPGYVGYEEGGYLTEAVRRKPYSVILLDEVEKAHPDVFNVLLQVLDDGRMTDGQGRTVDFKNTVIVMTSNLGSQMIQQMAGSDYGVIKLAVMAEVKTYFRPEFINRIDEVVVFHSLDEKNIASIAKIQLGYLEKRLAQMEMQLVVDDAALLELAKAGFDPVFGARPLKRAIQQQIENPLAKSILEGRFGAKDRILVSSDNGVLRFAKG
jgi:ATP-dependent Clp protease ATP-binding subunit ClpB